MSFIVNVSFQDRDPPRFILWRWTRLLVPWMLGATAFGAVTESVTSSGSNDGLQALLLSSTTLAGKGSLEHGHAHLAELFEGRKRILLINFASLPEDRDAYARRMQRDFARIDPQFEVESLHAVAPSDSADRVNAAEGIFVSGGNTFLLLRELHDRGILDLIRKRISQGLPYAGSSAGSNLAGTVVGTTNDFPLVDIPTRRALGILPGTFNPHHPDLADEAAFASRQWKIRQYARHHPAECVFAVNNAGMIRIDGEKLTLVGEGALAVLQLGSESLRVEGSSEGNLSEALSSLRRTAAAASK